MIAEVGNISNDRLKKTSKLGADGWGPDGKRGCFSLTLDNFGEVAEEQLRLEPVRGVEGQHLTVEYLPEMLKLLENSPVTYFIEGCNTQRYPEQLMSIRDAGHEIGMHAWRHEKWFTLDDAARRENVRRCLGGFERLGIPVQGFRPPGGRIMDGEAEELANQGIIYYSPLGGVGATRFEDEILSFPFNWRHVDAYMLHPDLGALRTAFGDSQEPFSLRDWEKSIESAIETAVKEGVHVSMIFHPFLFARDDRMIDALRLLVESVANHRDLWVAQYRDIANWALSE